MLRNYMWLSDRLIYFQTQSCEIVVAVSILKIDEETKTNSQIRRTNHGCQLPGEYGDGQKR